MSMSIQAITFLTLALLGSTLSAQISKNPTRAYEQFHADFSSGSVSAAFDGAKVEYGDHNAIIWANHSGIEVHYPAGSYKPSAEIVGGFGLWTDHKASKQVTFKYSVFFPVGFNFVKGGKLPGMYGGKRLCTGGDPAEDCFSTRLMWRTNGMGEAYLYANRDAQNQSICEIPENECNPDFGWSLNRGAWTFKTGEWTHLEETVRLNDIGSSNGLLSVKVNGKEVIRYDIIVYRVPLYPNMGVDGLDVETFFGGGSEDWATPTDQVVQFKDFILINEDPEMEGSTTESKQDYLRPGQWAILFVLAYFGSTRL